MDASPARRLTPVRETIEHDVDLARVEAQIQEWKLELLHFAERIAADLNELRFEVSEQAADLCHIAWAKDLGPHMQDAIQTITRMQSLWRAHMQRVQRGTAQPPTSGELHAQLVRARAT